MHPVALLLVATVQVQPAELVRFMPDSARNVMLLSLAGELFPFDKLIEPLDDVLPFDAKALIGGIRPLSMGAVSIGAGDQKFAPLAIVHMEDDWSQTIILRAPDGTGPRAAKMTQKLDGLPFEQPEISWSTLVLDDHTFALVRAANAPALAHAVKQHKIGRPRVLTRPLSPVDGLIAEVRSTPAKGGALMGGEHVEEAVAVIRKDRDETITLALSLHCAHGKGRVVAGRLADAAAKASGRIAEVYRAGKIDVAGDVVRASYVIPAKLGAQILFSK